MWSRTRKMAVRWFALIGFLAVAALVLLVGGYVAIEGNPLAKGTSSAQSAAEGDSGYVKPPVKDISDQALYDDYVAQKRGARKAQAEKDHQAIGDLLAATELVSQCGMLNADYGVPDYTQCSQLPELAETVTVEGTSNTYTISASAGAATFTETWSAPDSLRSRTCDQPEVGACAINSQWYDYKQQQGYW